MKSKQKYCETLKVGYYLIENSRCFYITGTTKGNKWIDLEVPNPEWVALIWTCIDPYEINLSTYHESNPIN